MNSKLVAILTPSLSMSEDEIGKVIGPMANMGYWKADGVENLDQFLEQRKELVSIGRKAKASKIVEAFIVNEWEIEPVEAADAVDEVLDVNGNIVTEAADAVDAVEGIRSPIRSRIDAVAAAVNAGLSSIHNDDAADIRFSIEFSFDSDVSKAWVGNPQLSMQGNAKPAGNGGSNNGNGSWKVDCWKPLEAKGMQYGRLLIRAAKNAGIDVPDGITDQSKVDDVKASLDIPVRVAYDMPLGVNISMEGFCNMYLLKKESGYKFDE